MQLIIDSKRYSDPPLVDDSGGTAEIYSLGNDALAKVFSNKLDTSGAKWFERRNKILALCNSFHNHAAQFGTSKFAFPENPAYEFTVNPDTLVGFAMKDFGRIPKIAELRFDLATGAFLKSGGIQLDDSSAIGLVYQIFEALDALHRARIILGDVSAGNVLFSPRLRHPVVIDIDSAQIGSFACTEVTPAFAAPELKARGTDRNGNYIYDAGTDVFAAAVVSYELLIGALPHFVFLSPPKTAIENRDLGVSSIRCFAMGSSYLSSFGLSYANVPENKAIERRLSSLKGQDRTLYDFFVSVFVKNERNNLLTFLPVEDRRHPGYLFLVKPEFKKFVDELVEQRRKAAQIAATPMKAASPAPAVSVAHADFRSFITKLGGLSTPQAKPTVKTTTKRGAVPVTKTDPPQLAAFLKQFNLSI